MLMHIQPGLYVTVRETDSRGPLPRPLQNGFNHGIAYRVLGGFTMSESAEMFFMLANDRNELWFISNRHWRAHAVHPEVTDFSYSLTEVPAHAI